METHNKSSFTLTFVIELLGIEVWHDCNEGWLDLGPMMQGIKLQYQLYPGQSFDIDLLIWPHCVKIWCGAQYGWVRTWQFLERRWMAFSISHLFPVRIQDLQNFTATVTPSSGIGALSNNAKNDKNTEVFLPPLKFREKRYFGLVVDTETETPLWRYFQDLIWNIAEEFIPPSYLDENFDVPHRVSDVRHQDAVFAYVQDAILNRTITLDKLNEPTPEIDTKSKDSKSTKSASKDKKSNEAMKMKFEIRLSGDEILAGTGRIILFDVSGNRPADLGDIAVMISTNNLPAQNDLPMLFINIDGLADVPTESLRKYGITHLYTRWKLGEEERISTTQIVRPFGGMNFKDHHAVPLLHDQGFNTVVGFLENPFEIEIRGLRPTPDVVEESKFFGYDKTDFDYDSSLPSKPYDNDTDILIAVCKVGAQSLAFGKNGFLRGEYPVYPLKSEVIVPEREPNCTNDINAVKALVRPLIVVPTSVILEAQMTLEVSMGLVGCRVRSKECCFSRLYCSVRNQASTMTLVNAITQINLELDLKDRRDEVLTGFALDMGQQVFFFVEGPRDREILKIWDLTEDFNEVLTIYFSSASRHYCRLYPEMTQGSRPFLALKMHVPINSLLACPPVYVRPALPLPTRAAILKIGRLLAGKLRNAPSRDEMPTIAELRSFRLELCAPPKPPPAVVVPDDDQTLRILGGVASPHRCPLLNEKKHWDQ